MIAFETEGWAGAELEVTIDGNTQTWAFDSQIGGDAASAVSVLEDIASWLVSTFAAQGVTAAAVGAAAGDASRIDFTLTITGDVVTSYDADTVLAGKLGWSSAVETPGVATFPASGETNTGAIGSVYVDVWAVANWTRWGRARGQHCSSAAWVPGVAASELRRPLCRGIFDELEVLALDAAQAAASSPRRAHVYQEDAAAWRFVAVGAIDEPEPEGDLLYRVGLEVLG